MYDYQYDKMPYEKYRDSDRLLEVKKHEVREYYPHFHYATEICYVRCGSFCYTVNGELGKADTGDMLFINSGEMHQYFESENCEVTVCIMSEIYAADFIAEFGDVAFENLLKNKEVNGRISALMDEQYRAQKSSGFLENKIFANKLYLLLSSAYTPHKSEETEMLLNKVLEYVYNNCTEDLTVEQVARHFSYSPVTVSKLFQKKIKVDFRVFLGNVRADMVHRLLRDSKYKDWPLIQIVNECGFKSMATFYRSYKRRYNRLPERAESV